MAQPARRWQVSRTAGEVRMDRLKGDGWSNEAERYFDTFLRAEVRCMYVLYCIVLGDVVSWSWSCLYLPRHVWQWV
jgi:hypothetical protein